MTTLEIIISELSAAPEALLLEVARFIQSAKDNPDSVFNSSHLQRTPGLHQGEIWMSNDFNDPLPDEFWLGEDS
jgi:hypothetical protein